MTVTNRRQVKKLNFVLTTLRQNISIILVKKCPIVFVLYLNILYQKFEIVHVVLKFCITLLKVCDYYEMCLLKIPQFT